MATQKMAEVVAAGSSGSPFLEAGAVIVPAEAMEVATSTVAIEAGVEASAESVITALGEDALGALGFVLVLLTPSDNPNSQMVQAIVGAHAVSQPAVAQAISNAMQTSSSPQPQPGENPCPPCPSPRAACSRVDYVPPSSPHYPCPGDHTHNITFIMNQNPQTCACYEKKDKNVVCNNQPLFPTTTPCS